MTTQRKQWIIGALKEGKGLLEGCTDWTEQQLMDRSGWRFADGPYFEPSLQALLDEGKIARNRGRYSLAAGMTEEPQAQPGDRPASEPSVPQATSLDLGDLTRNYVAAVRARTWEPSLAGDLTTAIVSAVADALGADLVLRIPAGHGDSGSDDLSAWADDGVPEPGLKRTRGLA